MSLDKKFKYKTQYINIEKIYKDKIEALIAKYEDKIKSAEFLKRNGTWPFSESPSKAELERLNVRIYERGTFIEDLKELSKMLNYVIS